MHKSKWFALTIGLATFSLAAVSYASSSIFVRASTLQVTVPIQPTSSIAPSGALHVPFTKVDLTARGTDIAVDKIVVARTGPAADEAFEDIVLLNAHGDVLAEGSLDDRVVEFTDPIYIPRNTTLNITVAANITDDGAEFDGQMSQFVVTEILASGYIPLQ